MVKQECGPHVRVRLDDHNVALVTIDAPAHKVINMPRLLDRQTMLRATKDDQEGVRSVAERRPGKFAGR